MAIDEMKADIEKRYFDWLYELVCGKWEPRNLSFHRLLTFLYDTQFIPDNEMDCNRAVDGENLRDRFLDQQYAGDDGSVGTSLRRNHHGRCRYR